MRQFVEQIKKTVVFLGSFDQTKGPSFRATGFLVKIQKVYHLVTAKHVVVDTENGLVSDTGLVVFFNTKDGKINCVPIDDAKGRLNVNWMFHENSDVDVAVIPFDLNPETDDVKTIPDELFLDIGELCELDEVFFASYQPGVEPGKKIAPIMRRGTVSLIRDDKTFYVDGAAFPGNSGSPVFLKPQATRLVDGGTAIGPHPWGGRFLGIIGDYIPYQETAVSIQTGRPRVIFEENTGLSRAWSIAFLNDIVQSEPFQSQLERLLKEARLIEHQDKERTPPEREP